MSRSQLTDRVMRLGEIASDLESCDTVDELYEFTVAAADRVIDFDAAIVCIVEDGVFSPKAAYATQLVPGAPLAATDGIAGATVSTGETIRVDDVRTDELAQPSADRYRSLLSVPFTDSGVLQFHATSTGAFTQTDAELAELLVATVTNSLGRIRYERALGRERDQFAALFENIPDAALAYRLEGGQQIVEAVNSSFVGTFGIHGETVVGKPVSTLVPAGEDRDRPEQLAEADRRTDVEVVRETEDGERPFLLRNVPMRTDDDSVRGYLIYTDLTTLKAREQELERKNERLDQFASMVSHDLRNPLNVASGYLELAKETHESEELEAIGRAHRRMERLIDDVLSLARDGADVEDRQPVHLGTVVREAWDHVSTPTATLSVERTDIVEGDPSRLLQLFENLFRNAIEHAGPEVTVTVTATPDGFAVSDDGPGIPTADRERAFESGFTTTPGNTGLGLAIVEQVTTAHGWTISVTESEAGGTRFEVETGAAEGPESTASGGEFRE